MVFLIVTAEDKIPNSIVKNWKNSPNIGEGLGQKYFTQGNKSFQKENYSKAFHLYRKTVEIGASFKLTEQSYEKLRKDSLSDDISIQLISLKNQPYIGEKDFVEAIEKAIGYEQTIKYKLAILKSAEIGYDHRSHPEVLFNKMVTLYKWADRLYKLLIKGGYDVPISNDQSVLKHFFVPEYRVWHNWIVKYLLFLSGGVAFFKAFTTLGKSKEKIILSLFIIFIGAILLGYYI